MDDTLDLGLNIQKKRKITIGKLIWTLIFTIDILLGIILIASSFGHGEFLLWLLVP